MDALAAALAAVDVACVALRLDPADAADRQRAIVDQFVAITQRQDVALVIDDDAALAAAAGADGVVLAGPAGYRAARTVVGPTAIVGVRAGSSRHDAMVAAEAGADFVGLAGDADLVSWWAELMEPPAVAFADGGDPAAIGALAAAGADFVAPGPALWRDDNGRTASPAVFRDRLTALADAIRAAGR